jgi:hypothetical protein
VLQRPSAISSARARAEAIRARVANAKAEAEKARATLVNMESAAFQEELAELKGKITAEDAAVIEEMRGAIERIRPRLASLTALAMRGTECERAIARLAGQEYPSWKQNHFGARFVDIHPKAPTLELVNQVGPLLAEFEWEEQQKRRGPVQAAVETVAGLVS